MAQVPIEEAAIQQWHSDDMLQRFEFGMSDFDQVLDAWRTANQGFHNFRDVAVRGGSHAHHVLQASPNGI